LTQTKRGAVGPWEVVGTDVQPRDPSLRRRHRLAVALLVGLSVFAAVAGAGILSVPADAWPVWLLVLVVGAVPVTGIAWRRSAGTRNLDARNAEAGFAALHAEIARSRRHDRRFVLIGIPASVWLPTVTERGEEAVLGTTAAHSLHSVLRTPDRAWVDGSVLHVLLTECDSAQAQAFLLRTRTSMPHLFQPDKVRLAAFPEDGVTVGALLDAVKRDASENKGAASIVE